MANELPGDHQDCVIGLGTRRGNHRGVIVDSMPARWGRWCRWMPTASKGYQATDTLLPDKLLGAVFNLEIGKPLWGLTL